jgi:hypothetical protein
LRQIVTQPWVSRVLHSVLNQDTLP